MRKVLLIGYGSIGRKYLSLLIKVKQITDVYIYTKQRIDETKKVKKINLNSFKKINPHLIIIANQTSLHFKTINFIEKNFSKKIVLVEKPLFDKYLRQKIKYNSYYIAYNLRFHPVLKKIKKLIAKQELWYVQIKQSSYLPEWRKNINYKYSTSALKSKGGGVLLELSHELDILENIFGNILPSFSYNSKISNLKINTDDILIISGTVKKRQKKILFNLSSNMFSRNKVREIYIDGKSLSIRADLLKNTIIYFQKDKKKKISFPNFFINQTYDMQLKSILSYKFDNLCTYEEGLNIMKVIEKIRKKN